MTLLVCFVGIIIPPGVVSITLLHEVETFTTRLAQHSEMGAVIILLVPLRFLCSRMGLSYISEQLPWPLVVPPSH